MNHQTHWTKKEIDSDKLWGAIGYFFFPLPLIFAKNRSSFLNYHINQGDYPDDHVAFWGQFVLGIIPGWLGFMLDQIFKLIVILYFIMGVLNVAHKRTRPLPIIGEWFDFLK